jgi:hypothetical protein
MNASQGYIHKYENLKRKLDNFSANIYFEQSEDGSDRGSRNM